MVIPSLERRPSRRTGALMIRALAFWALALGAILLIVASLTTTASAQMRGARAGELPELDAATRAAVVDSIAAVIDSVYVLGEPAERIVAHLQAQLAAGAYDDLSDPVELVQTLERECQEVNHDGHFGIVAMHKPEPTPASEAEGAEAEDPEAEDPEAEVEERRRFLQARNYGFAKVEILPGNVGYLKFDFFADTEDPGAGETAAAAMNFLANASAVIIDLRENGGGAASMIRLLAGYFFAENTHLINWDIRAQNKTVQSYSADVVPGRRLDETPVYVLTSGRTFSAAEEFTFDLKHLERATVVGDTTGGGGHTVAGYEFEFADFVVGIRVPYGRAYDPKTNEGWEGTGVAPHIAVPAEQALTAADLPRGGRALVPARGPSAFPAGADGRRPLHGRRPGVLPAELRAG